MRRFILLLTLIMLVIIPAVAQDDLAEVPRERTLILDCLDSPCQSGQINDWNIFNPYLPATVGRTGYNFMLEPLYFYNAYAEEDNIIPWIAESHEYNDDFTEVTVNIRDGVKWDDGTPWTANDLVFTINMLRENAPTLLFSVNMQTWVESAEVVDDLTAKITLTSPNPRFIFTFFTHNFDNGIPIVPAHIWEGKDPTEFTFYDEEQGWPVLTGPYTLALSSPQQRIWDVREDWWAAEIGFRELPQVERIIYLPFFEPAQRLQNIVTNQLDSALDFRPVNIIAAVNQNENISTFSGREAPYGYLDWWPITLGFNHLEEPWNDVDIRRAVSFAINQQQLVDIGYQGAGEPAVLPFPDFIPLQQYTDLVQDVIAEKETAAFDPDRTAEIMESKGYALNDAGFWEKDGVQVDMVIEIFGIFEDITPILVEQLRRAGFNASFRQSSDSFNRMSTGEAHVFLFGNGGSVRDPWKTLGNYHSRFNEPTGTPANPFWRWSNDEFDTIVDQMSTIDPSDPALKDLFVDAMTIWLDELPAIPVVQWLHRIPHNETYWTNWPTVDNPYINSAYWHRTWLLVLLGLEPAQ